MRINRPEDHVPVPGAAPSPRPNTAGAPYQSFEELEEAVGSWGKYQRNVLYFLSCIMWSYIGALTVLLTFTTQDVPRYPDCSVIAPSPAPVAPLPVSPTLPPAPPNVTEGPANVTAAEGGGGGSNQTTGEWEMRTAVERLRVRGLIDDVSRNDSSSSNATNATVVPECDASKRLPPWDCSTPYVYSSSWLSVVSTFDLACKETFFSVSTINAFYFVGFCLGVFTFGILSDTFGRHTAFALGSTVCQLFAVTCAFAASPAMYAFARFLTAFGGCGAMLVIFVHVEEIVAERHRFLPAAVGSVAFALGICSLALIASTIFSWRLLSLVIALPGFWITYAAWLSPIMHEGPRWLMSQRDYDNALLALKHMAAQNRRIFPPEVTAEVLEQLGGAEEAREAGKGVLPAEMSSLVLVTPLREWAGVKLWVWFACGIGYYGPTLAIGQLGGNIYAAIAIAGLIESVANFTSCRVSDIPGIGRKGVVSFSLTIASLIFFCTPFIPRGPFLAGAAVAARTFAAAALAVVYLYTAELFPTSVRNAAVGAASLSGHAAGCVVPFIIVLGQWLFPSLPLVIFGSIGGVAVLLLLGIPDTLHREPFDTVAQVEESYRRHPSAHLGIQLSINEQTCPTCRPKVLDESDVGEVGGLAGETDIEMRLSRYDRPFDEGGDDGQWVAEVVGDVWYGMYVAAG
ncbi:unnamed protein product [Vitrella brassicaformis CCMP3155]|uniref:Major facilitator superfamily (MFS) profile domain-containing protein n=2 Tax=Vitrella brassicaformis TaxID=1169539 RepID=A0A0G4FMQ7_VITBC|nr:unnamed protein product [Vitrella brassicaformis CCMP3155]|eukprot:CEM15528.1 unnamed protein product [Vitrella brassicaformis CCMP3155]